MTVANTIDDAMDLLKSSTDEDEVIEEENIEEEEVEKAVELDMIKAEDDAEIAQLVQADDFMIALAQNQDINTERLTKSIEATMNATYSILDFIKSQQSEIQSLRDEVAELKATPQPGKAVMSKSEANELQKSITPSPNEESSGVSKLQKSDIVGILNEAAKDGQAESMDVVKAETAFGGSMSMQEIAFEDVIASFSPGGRKAIKNFLDSQQ